MNREVLSDIMNEARDTHDLDLPWKASCDEFGPYFRTYIDGHGHIEDGRYITLYETDDTDVLIDLSDEDALEVLLESIARSAYPLGVARDCVDGYVRMYYAGTSSDIANNYETVKVALLDTLCCFFSLCYL